MKVGPKTYDNHRTNVVLHIKPALGKVSIAQLTTPMIQRFVVSLTNEKGLAPSSARQIYVTLKAALAVAERWNLIRQNPAKGAQLPKLRGRQQEVFTVEQLQHLMDSLDVDWFGVAVLLGLTTGMRRGEVLGLRYCDVDQEHNLLHVRQSCIRVKDKILIVPPKTAKSERTVPVPDIAQLALSRFMEQQQKLNAILQRPHAATNLIFTGQSGGPMDPTYLSNLFRQFCKRHRLSAPRLHGLRHTFATLLITEARMPLTLVSKLLGHNRTSTTADVYAHLLHPISREGAAWWDQTFRAPSGHPTGDYGTV
jgi:integrase